MNKLVAGSAKEVTECTAAAFTLPALPAATCCCAAANGFGAVALAALLAEEGHGCRSPSNPSQAGPQRHLPLHGRRPVAGRHLRLQAAAGEVPRPRSAHRLQGRADAVQQRRQGDGLAVEVQAARPERPAGSANCSRTSPSCVDDLAVVRSMVVEIPRTHHRPIISSTPVRASRAGRAWGPGSATASAARTRTCPASSSSTAA